jgi:diadenosine tetraphosphate (Ap4A) HIT family hydrolase
MEDYSKNIIKDCQYWTVLVHTNQGYLGRCVVWCKRENAQDLTEATKEERDELFAILSNLKKAIERAFRPDWMNYAFLGNELQHLHGHVIPRYSAEREFEGVRFRDERWGHNYQTDHDFVTPPEILESVKCEIKKHLDQTF